MENIKNVNNLVALKQILSLKVKRLDKICKKENIKGIYPKLI